MQASSSTLARTNHALQRANHDDDLECVLNGNVEISYGAAANDYRAGRYIDSLTKLNKLVDTQKDARTFALLGKTLDKLNMPSEAAQAYTLAADMNTSHSDDYRELALLLHHKAGNEDLVLALGNKLVSRARKDPSLAYPLATILIKRNQVEAAAAFKEVLAKSDDPTHMVIAARMLLMNWEPNSSEHIETARLLLTKIPANNTMRLLYLTLCREISRYDVVEKQQKVIEDAIAAGKDDFIETDHPFFNLHWTGDERLNHKSRLQTLFMPEGARERRRALPHTWREDKIRIGYVSGDFWDQHATMKLVRRMFELHDRDRFEVTLFCNTPKFLLEKNKADRSAWGDIVEIRDMTDEQTLAEIHKRQIDILVDMKGYTKFNRAQIFNEPAAPVHVEWLGFPGSTVGLDLDYIIGDRWVLPDSSERWYDETFCRLPECYQPNDAYYRPQVEPIARKDIGLPEDKFVFASFNGNRKITYEMTSIWAEILRRTPDSILWIMRNNTESQKNINKRFEKLGIPLKRIYFMHLEQYQDHMNRIPLADLGLDTFPVNGHTTTSEQLWAGLPVLTAKGTNFASRVSESLLSNIGLPELIAASSEDYIEQAVALYNDRDRLQNYRKHIIDQRFMSPLFDSERFTRHIEKAYEMMAERAKAGLEPAKLDVPVLPKREGPFMRPDEAVTTDYMRI